MAFTRVQINHGGSNTQIGTATATLSAATAGNLLIMYLASDAYATAGAPTGFTESTGTRQETFLGHYVWWKVAAGGETSVAKALSPNGTHCWIIEEWSGGAASPYDISNGQKAQSSAINYTTPAVTPTAGDRLLIGSIGGSHGTVTFTGEDTWLNSFTSDPTHGVALADISGAHDVLGVASNTVTANGSTSYSTGANYTPSSAESRTGIIVAFKAAASGTVATPTVAAATGAADSAVASVVAVTGVASATGVADDATVSTTPQTTAPAGESTATGIASDAVAVAAVAPAAAGATGTANSPTAVVGTNGAEAAASALAADAVAALVANAGIASATGIANDATVTTSTSGTATPAAATATGAAMDATVRLGIQAVSATAAGTAYDVTLASGTDFVCQDLSGAAVPIAYSGSGTAVAYGGSISKVSYGGTATICGR